MRPVTTSRNSAARKKCGSQPKKPRQDAYHQVEDGSEEDEEEDNDDTPQTMWTGVPRHTKFESRPGHKAVLNCAMPYLVSLMITGPEFSEDPENDQINPWPEDNPMALDRTMVEVWNKWALELRRREGRQDQDVADGPTGFEARRVRT